MAEQRMLEKLTRSLTEDITPLLPVGIQFGELDAIHAFERVWIELIARMGGEGWKLAEPVMARARANLRSDWMAAHTVRGTFSGAPKKKPGLVITSSKPDGGERTYRTGS